MWFLKGLPGVQGNKGEQGIKGEQGDLIKIVSIFSFKHNFKYFLDSADIFIEAFDWT